MPLDPSIILGGVNVSDVIAKQQATLAQQQATRQQLQLRQYGVAQAKQDFEDQRNWRTAIQQSGGDWDKAVQIGTGLGMSGKALQAMRMQQLQTQQAQENLAKTHGENEVTRRAQVFSHFSPLLGEKDPVKFAQLKEQLKGSIPAGVAKDDDLALLKTLTPDNVNQAAMAYLDPKARAEVQTAQTKVDEDVRAEKLLPGQLQAQKNANQDFLDKEPGIKADSATKVVTNIFAQRKVWADKGVAAYNAAGGGVAGAFAYDKAVQGAPDDVKGGMPAGQDVAKVAGTKDQFGQDAGLSLIQQSSLSQEEKQDLAVKAAGQRETSRHNKVEEGQGATRIGIERENTANGRIVAQAAMGDREINALTKPHQAVLTTANTQLEKITEAKQMLNSGNAEGLALAIPKVLTAVVSGAGSGVRVTQPELNAIAKARGVTGSIEALFIRATSGKPLTSDQVKQLQGVLSDVQDKVETKANIANDTINAIQNAPDRAGRIAAEQNGRQRLMESGKPNAAPTGAPGRNRGNF